MDRLFQHPVRLRIGLAGAPIMAATAAWLATVTGHDRAVLYLGAAFFGVGAVLIPFRLVRRIRFGPRIYVDRYLLPPREFEYADVVDIGLMAIKTKRGIISLYGMQNTDELHSILHDAMRRGALSEGQIEGTLASRELRDWAAVSYALIPSVVLAVLLDLIWRCPCQC